MRSTYVVTLRGMRFHARVGVLAHEREHAQPLEIDLSVWAYESASLPPPMLDYRALYDRTAAVVGAGHIPLLEDVAHRVAVAALEDAAMARVRVAARKPHVALPGPLQYAEVVLDLDRDG